jgi:hypothetical protein
MFDNEIDWVTQLELPRKRREADKWLVSSKCVKYKAEHMQRVSARYWLRQVFKKSFEECL